MPVYLLTEQLVFPDPNLAAEDGLLAVGGDLSAKRLLLAYRQGIFPWYSSGEPLLWWSPDPRFVLFPNELKVSKSMKQVLKKGTYTITTDTAFREVVTQCRKVLRPGQSGTWITKPMLEAYCRLHEAGFAHSAEAWNTETGELAGGLYGISLGGHFYGESMFSCQSNASKTAFIVLVKQLAAWGFTLIDAQLHTQHLESLGAVHIARSHFLQLLKENRQKETLQGNWRLELTMPFV